MVVSWPGSMRGPQVKTPLLLLLLLSTLTGTVLCQNKDDDTDPDPGEGGKGEPEGDSDTETVDPDLPESDATTAPDPRHTQKGSEYGEEEDNGSGNDESKEISNVTATTSTPDEELSPLIILIPVVLVVLIIGMIVCAIFINRRWNKKVKNQELQKEDPYLDGSSTEKVPMPMFEEDVPSVLELEMEELDQWMKKDGESAEDSKYP